MSGWWWKRRKTHVPAPRPDRVKIALLEYELFGIEPEPGTAAAAVISLQQIARGGISAAQFPAADQPRQSSPTEGDRMS
ncbi:MAG TPA: hypothetical protein VFY14_12320 [Streptomyces sp.]|nr:hypothetical protein [Streptomyces sp.]